MTNSATLLASTVMDTAASLNNDTAKATYTYVAQIPYLNIALRELQKYFELNDMPVTASLSALINVPAGVTSIGFAPTPPIALTPYLPNDLIEPKKLWECLEGTAQYVPMTKVDGLPLYDEGTTISNFGCYVWESQTIKVLESSQDNDIKMEYLRSIFNTITASGDSIGVVNAQGFLEFRTAALCAEYIGEDTARAERLNNGAGLSLDVDLGIGAKGRQNIMTRRRPFRRGYKSRN